MVGNCVGAYGMNIIIYASSQFIEIFTCVHAFLLQDYLGSVIVFTSIIVFITTAKIYPEATSPSLIALALNYTLLIPIYLNWVVKLSADLEMYIGAVERISLYINANDNSTSCSDDESPNELMAIKSNEKC